MDYSNMSNEELEQLIEQQDDMNAACEMAERHLYGTKAEPNLNRAYQLFHRAETHGNVRAYQGLAYMYENGILFAQNLELAKDYYAKAGIYKTEMAPEQVRLTNEQKVAAAIARSEAPTTVVVNTGGPIPGSENGPLGTEAPPVPEPAVSYGSPAPTDPYNAAPVQPAAASYASPAPQPAVQASPTYASPAPQPQASSAGISGEAANYARAAAEKAAEAAEAAKIAAAKAQEAASAADLAAEYARRACQ